MTTDDCKYYDAEMKDDHEGHDHDDDHDDHGHDDEASEAATTAPTTADGSIHMQTSSALVFGILFLAYVGILP
jgi:hypothetical protein